MSRHNYHGDTTSRGRRLASKLRGITPVSLARLDELLRRTPQKEDDMTRIDPWPDYAPYDPRAKDDPATAPNNWHRLARPTRERLGGVLLEVLDEYPDKQHPQQVGFLAHRVWERVRVDRDAELDLQKHVEIASPTEIIAAALAKLVAAGSLEATLLARRDAIDRQLAVLARMRAAADATKDDSR